MAIARSPSVNAWHKVPEPQHISSVDGEHPSTISQKCLAQVPELLRYASSSLDISPFCGQHRFELTSLHEDIKEIRCRLQFNMLNILDERLDIGAFFT